MTKTTTLVRRFATSARDGASGGKRRLVVLGTGWGGYAFLKTLSPQTLDRFEVRVVSPTTSFSFTPLLAQASCGTLDFRSALEPIHSTPRIQFHHAWCDALDLSSRRIELTPATKPQFRPSDPLQPPGKEVEEKKRGGYVMEYDALVIAVGSYNATFGTEGVKEHALFLKDVSDARAIRWKILTLFETANTLPSPTSAKEEAELRARLSFVVVGGGPTGAEFAAELHDLIRQDLVRLYPHLTRYASIKLLDAGTSILSSFDRGLAEYAMRKFTRDGIEVRLQTRILRVDERGVWVDKDGAEELVSAGMVVWSTGITTCPLIQALQGVGKEQRSGKLLTDDRLNLLIHPQATTLGGNVHNPPSASDSTEGQGGELVALRDVWAIGDCASQQTEALPATAQVANQKGIYLANHFNSPSSNNEGFKFSDRGSMASIGSNEALIDSPAGKEHGALAWVLWRSAYTLMAMSWRNRFLVPANWASNTLFGRDIGRF